MQERVETVNSQEILIMRAAAVLRAFEPNSQGRLAQAGPDQLAELYGPFRDEPSSEGFRFEDEAGKPTAVRDTVIRDIGRLPEDEREDLLVGHLGVLAGSKTDPEAKRMAELACDRAARLSYGRTREALRWLTVRAIENSVKAA